MQQTQAESALDLRPGARGRKREGVEEVPKMEPIRESSAEMMKLYRRLKSAQEGFNECIKAVAERSNVNSSTLKKLVTASFSGDFPEHRCKVEQMSIVFDQVGEIAGGKGAD